MNPHHFTQPSSALLGTATALVNGAAGAVIVLRGRPFAVLAFTVRNDRIVEIDAIAGAERVRRIAASVLG